MQPRGLHARSLESQTAAVTTAAPAQARMTAARSRPRSRRGADEPAMPAWPTSTANTAGWLWHGRCPQRLTMWASEPDACHCWDVLPVWPAAGSR